MLQKRAPFSAIPRPAWARVSPFPSHLLTPPAHGQEGLLLALLFLTTASSAIVQIDVIYSTLAVLTSGLFLLLGIRLDRANAPFILMLMLYNIGGFIALQSVLEDEESRAFMVGTCFVGVTGVFFMLVLNENAVSRLEAIRWGTITGALIASVVGLIGYVGIVDFATLHGGRVMGTFRDPNVFGSFAAAGAVMLASDILTNPRRRLIKLAMLLIISTAVFLSFSRGSWGNLALGFVLLMGLTVLTTHDATMRARVLIAALIGLVVLALALAVMLSNDDIYQVFADRFVLQKDYDSGPSGRFGSQLRSIPDLLGRPFGHGPNRFSYYYPENPHNTYVMAFSSYGWLGGITFWCFIISLVFVTLRAAVTRSPFQPYTIMAASMLLPHLIQNLQIDTDRWRHLFMIYGLCWGLAVITLRYAGEYSSYAHGAYRAAAARLGFQPASKPA